MSTIQPSVRALGAHEVLERLEKLFETEWYRDDCTLHISTGIASLAWNVRYNGGKPTNPTELESVRAVLRSFPNMPCQAGQVSRANHQHNRQVAYNCNDGIVGTFGFGSFDSQPILIGVFEVLQRLFDMSMFVDVASAVSPDLQKQSLQVRERATADLAAAQQKLEFALVDLAVKESDRRTKLEADLEARHQRRTTELEEKNAAERREIEEWRKQLEADLDTRKADHERKVADFETREARAVRRSMQQRLETVLKESETLQLSASVTAKRDKTEKSIWVLVGAAVLLAAFAGWKLFSDAFEWRYAVPFASSTFVLWATLTYYVQWNDRWAREHAAAEMLTRRYRADAVRANWLAEWVSEASENGSATPLPSDLLAAFTRNLFNDPSIRPEAQHSLERVVDQAKEFEVGKDKVSVRVGPGR
jgi:Skp family chaperone for outer membrane proteins